MGRSASHRTAATGWRVLLGAGVVLGVVLLAWWVLGGHGQAPGSRTPVTAAGAAGAGTSGQPPVPTGNAAAAPAPAPTPVTDRPAPVHASIGARVGAGAGVSVQVTRVEQVQGTARGVGELAAPGLRFTVRVTNKPSGQVANLDLAVLTGYFGPKHIPAPDLSGPGASPLPQTLQPGRSAQGRYVFAVPPAERGRVRVDFSYDAAAPTVVFTGSAH